MTSDEGNEVPGSKGQSERICGKERLLGDIPFSRNVIVKGRIGREVTKVLSAQEEDQMCNCIGELVHL